MERLLPYSDFLVTWWRSTHQTALYFLLGVVVFFVSHRLLQHYLPEREERVKTDGHGLWALLGVLLFLSESVSFFVQNSFYLHQWEGTTWHNYILVAAPGIVWGLRKLAVGVVALILYRFGRATAALVGGALAEYEGFNPLLLSLVEGALTILLTLLPLSVIAYHLAGIDLFPFLKGIGFTGIGTGAIVGLASQDLVKNFFGALVIMVERPFKLKDWIVVKEKEGRVEKIGLRATKLATPVDGDFYISNSVFTTEPVQNYGACIRRKFTIKVQPISSQSQASFGELVEAFDRLLEEEDQLQKDISRLLLTSSKKEEHELLLLLLLTPLGYKEEAVVVERFLTKLRQAYNAMGWEIA